MPPRDLSTVAPLQSRWRATMGGSKGQLYVVFEHTWDGCIGLRNRETKRKHWISFAGITRKYVRIPDESVEQAEGRFPVAAWKEIFSQVPPYPMHLSDELVRAIAGLAIHTREASREMESGLRSGNLLLFNMPLSLISGAVKHINEQAGKEWERKDDPETPTDHRYMLDDGGE